MECDSSWIYQQYTWIEHSNWEKSCISTRKVIRIRRTLKHKNELNTIKYVTSNIQACENDGASIQKKHT